MIIIGLIASASLLIPFCIGKILFNERVGLLGALFLGFANDFIFWGYYIIPMSLGASVTIVLIYLVIKRTAGSQELAFTVLFLLGAATLIYTHTIAALIFLVIFGSMYLGERLVRLWSKGQLSAFLSYVAPVLFGVAMLSIIASQACFDMSHFYVELNSGQGSC